MGNLLGKNRASNEVLIWRFGNRVEAENDTNDSSGPCVLDERRA